ncbi:NAD(P)-dependent oxidoreductase [Rhodoplanes sp. Z2-YC6860]|uniref:NAD(P)-dependent oxidoreductase n=1 Tax=Rhodoplanes sp. Z2-YC6860 TaxID=674703 RepID=UPI00078B2D6B|nr:NAD(P)-dependent oxidoreductase [Rhodoplanes sp. Z2-YC6860]AMN38626.1 6-phosphogluconate dehydrogenase [Rhodoplanes sp. Z2-YC6860]
MANQEKIGQEKIGIVGVGRMGQAMTRHLIKNGYAVLAQDVEPKALEAARALGAETVKTPAEVGRTCKFVIVAVGYDNEAEAVMLGAGGLLETMGVGSVIGMSSTCTPEHVKMLAEKAQAKGVEVLDAPICRGQRAADTGTMLILCGGKSEVFERGKPIYSTFGKDIVLLGDIGAGQVGKAMNNFLLWVNGIALIEAGRLSEANGMDLVKLREALLMSSGASDALKNWENVSFLWALKDMQIVSKMADKAGLAMPIAGAIKELVKDGRRIKQSNPPDWTGRKRV